MCNKWGIEFPVDFLIFHKSEQGSSALWEKVIPVSELESCNCFSKVLWDTYPSEDVTFSSIKHSVCHFVLKYL